MTDLEKLMSYVIPEPNSGCWLWLGGGMADYTGMRFRGEKTYAHRVSYELHKGPVPDGLELHHLCGVKFCVNPDHLEALSHAEHIRKDPKRRGPAPLSRLQVARFIAELTRAP